jgi:predicted nucleic acid-binding protein
VSVFVVDASVAIKWLLPSEREPLHAEALSWLDRYTNGEVKFIVPDLFWAEIGNCLWKSIRYARLTTARAQTALEELKGRRLEAIPCASLVDAALEIAVGYQRSAYDSFYVALAVQAKTELITADEKLANALSAYLPVKWLGSV